MPHKELLDPQGKTVAKNMKHIDIDGVQDVRVGKRIELVIDADSAESAKSKTEIACKKLLANEIMEVFDFEIEEVK